MSSGGESTTTSFIGLSFVPRPSDKPPEVAVEPNVPNPDVLGKPVVVVPNMLYKLMGKFVVEERLMSLYK